MVLNLKKQTKSLFEVHFAVFLFGFSALFGKTINQPPLIIVYGRVFFASLTLAVILLSFKQKFKLNSSKDYLMLILLGAIFAVHWLTFFLSIKVSSIAIAVLTFSTFPIFVTFMEPYFLKGKIRQSDVISALIVFLGVLLVIPSYEIKNNITQGAFWGIIAGFTCAILTVFSKKYVKKYPSTLISFYQCTTATIVLLPFIIIHKPLFESIDIIQLILLGVIFTALSHTLFIKSIEHINAQLASIITCLEPVYSITFAIFLLKEIPSVRTIIGGSIILGAIIYATSKQSLQTQVTNTNKSST